MNDRVRAVIEQTEILREKNKQIILQHAPNNLFIFNRYVLGVEKNGVSLAPFHKHLCKFIDDEAKKKKLILIPRGHLKSTLITIGYSLQQITKNPNIRILIMNATWQMAVDFLTEIKRHLTSNEELLDLFGNIAADPDEWSQDRITIKRTDHNVKGPTVWAAGVETNLVGSHPDIIILDDVMNRDNSQSRESVDKVILRYKDALDLLEPSGKLIVIGTRWTEVDFYSWILDRENNLRNSFDVMINKAYEGNLEDPVGFVPLWPEKFTREELLTRQREKGWYEFCTPSETPILMSDFTVKPIKLVKPGDEVIGFERRGNERMVLTKTIVKNKSSLLAPVNTLVMDSGRIIRCTKQHKWYTARGRTDKSHNQYIPAKVGRELMYVCPVEEKVITEEEKNAWSYLAGIFDGEGSAKSGGCLTISQGFKNKVVINKIRQTLKFLKIEYSEYIKKAHTSKRQPNDGLIIWLKDNFQTQLNLIRYGNPAKKYQIADKMIKKGKRFIRQRDRVIKITEGEDEEVFALETGTGNYIAWGYASSNSAQYLNNPVPDEAAVFKSDWFKKYDVEDVRGTQLTKALTVDPAISLEKEADYTAMIVTGIDQFGNIYILDMVRGKFTPNQVVENVFALDELWKPNSVGIETTIFQKALAYNIREKSRERGRYMPITELRVGDRTKDQRIKGLQPQYENLKIFHPRNHKLTPYLEDELRSFPRGSHDDLIDALSYCLDLLFPPKPKVRRYHHEYLY